MIGEGIWTVLLSGTVGILLGGLIQAATSRYAAFKEGKGIAAAIRAEIEALLHTIDRANNDEAIRRKIKILESAVSRPTHNDVFTFTVSANVFQVFDSLCHKIGLLDNLSAQVVGVYVIGKAWVTNIRTLGELRERLLSGQFAVEREALLGLTRDVARLLQEFLEAGRQVEKALAAYQRRRWLVVFH